MVSNHGRSLSIDLHVHSTASDGTLAPSEIVTLARKANLAAISITDHDTLEGVRQVLSRKQPADIHFLAGIEISASPPDSFAIPGSLHLLGYGMDVDAPVLNDVLENLRESREKRTPGIIAKLNALGISISLDEVRRVVGKGQVSRPHIARFLVKTGVATDIDDAFDRFLKAGGPAYVDRYRITAAETISIIRAAGGIPVLAHPFFYQGSGFGDLKRLIQQLAGNGLMGIEVYYPEHDAAFTRQLEILAGELNLLMTGGSDFHGALKPAIRLGRGYGDLAVPFALYETLMARLPRRNNR